MNKLNLKGYDELMRVNDEGEKVRVLMKAKKGNYPRTAIRMHGKRGLYAGTDKRKIHKGRYRQISKSGNKEEAWTPLSLNNKFLPYHRKLYRTAFRLTENPQEAEDMVQEAYLKLWNKRDELAGVLNTEAYCVTLVKNLCYDALRRSRPDEDGHAPEELNLPTDTNIAREVEQRDEVNQVCRLIGRLPEQQKRVILLRDVNDCSFEEIEQATGLNAINIRVLLSRARKKIREQYNAIMNYESK